MKTEEIAAIHSAIHLLNQILPGAETKSHQDITLPQPPPVVKFVKQYLLRDHTSDMTSNELLKFYNELVKAGEVEPLSPTELLRALPAAMLSTYGIRKRHNIVRDGKKLRGFRGVRMNDFFTPLEPPNLSPDPEPAP